MVIYFLYKPKVLFYGARYGLAFGFIRFPFVFLFVLRIFVLWYKMGFYGLGREKVLSKLYARERLLWLRGAQRRRAPCQKLLGRQRICLPLARGGAVPRLARPDERGHYGHADRLPLHGHGDGARLQGRRPRTRLPAGVQVRHRHLAREIPEADPQQIPC